jgi:hypothetical protein
MFTDYMLTKLDSGVTNAAGSVGNSINATGLPMPVKEKIISDISKYNNIADVLAEKVVTEVAHSILMFIVTVFAIVLIFAIIRFLMRFVDRFLWHVVRLPVINQANKFFGFIFGFAQGILAVYIAMAILTLLNAAPEAESIILEVNKSVIASWFYNGNIILKAVSGTIPASIT